MPPILAALAEAPTTAMDWGEKRRCSEGRERSLFMHTPYDREGGESVNALTNRETPKMTDTGRLHLEQCLKACELCASWPDDAVAALALHCRLEHYGRRRQVLAHDPARR